MSSPRRTSISGESGIEQSSSDKSIDIALQSSSGTDESELASSRTKLKKLKKPKDSPTKTIHSKSPLVIISEEIQMSTSRKTSDEIEDIKSQLARATINPLNPQMSEEISGSTSSISEIDYLEFSSSSGIATASLSSSPIKKQIVQEFGKLDTKTSYENRFSNVRSVSPKQLSTAGGPFLPRLISKTDPLISSISDISKLDEENYIWTRVISSDVKGVRNRSCLNNEFYYSFYGIPYAQPPVKKLRFKPPQPIETLPAIYDATKEKECCVQQRYMLSKTLIGSEDCLYLNIHIPKEPQHINKLLPVMVYIHGGGFFSGSGNSSWYSPDYIVKHNVILITFNFRLHILGFLNMEQSFCPGNMGLKDQVMALKWIQENIKWFGGNPNNVTIFGSSAGASSVNLHMVSPLSKGLFHKAIMQSGNMYCPWGVVRNSLRFTMEIVKKLGGPTSYPKVMLEFLEGQPIERLVDVAIRVNYQLRNMRPLGVYYEYFGPVIECYKEGAFLPHNLEDLKASANFVPTIAGLNNYEGLLQFSSKDFIVKKVGGKLDELLSASFLAPLQQCIEPAKLLKNYYFKRKSINHETREQLVNLYTDIYFYRFYDSIDFLITSSCPVYIYEFAYNGNLNLFTKVQVNKKNSLPGASHSDELYYLFAQKNKFKSWQLEPADIKMVDTMCKLWTSFAETGNPTKHMRINWNPFYNSKPSYLRIDKKLEMKNEKLNGKRFEFMQRTVANITTKF